MAATKISDVIVPDVFNPYMQERTKELTKLYLSGIITSNDELDLLAVAGGKLINMPFWQDLTGNDEVLTDSAALTPGNVSSEKDVATLLMRGRAWGANDLAKSLSGSDPMVRLRCRLRRIVTRLPVRTISSLAVTTSCTRAALHSPPHRLPVSRRPMPSWLLRRTGRASTRERMFDSRSW